jgi:acyl-coenzyme A thioesterase PaaI-like protein
MQGVFTESMGDLVTYRYVGCQSELIDRDHAVGTTTLRSHLRTSGSVSGVALAVSMLDTAGINVDARFLLGLTQVDLQLYEPALDVERMRTVGTVIRWARTQVFTECRFESLDEPGRVIGAGACNWSVLHPTPEGFVYTDPGPGLPESPDTPAMVDAFELETRPEGGFVVPALSTKIGAEVLHHGPMLVGAEQSSLSAAAALAGDEPLALASWTMRIVRPGRKAPFRVSAEVLTATAEVVACRSEMVDADGDVIVVSHLAFRRA